MFALALGIGASTVAFSAFYNLLFSAFAAKDANRLVVFSLQNSEKGVLPELNLTPLGGSLSDVDAIRSQGEVFDDVVGYHRGITLLRDGNDIHQVYATSVASNAFDFYGVLPLLGRGITPADGMAKSSPVFVMSYKTWKGEFHSDPGILGKTFFVDDIPRSLIGIMPPRFQAYGALVQVWTPITSGSGSSAADAAMSVDTMMARLKPGITLEKASADLDVIVKSLAKSHPNDFPKHFSARVLSATDFMLGPYQHRQRRRPGDAAFRHQTHALCAASRGHDSTFDRLQQCRESAARSRDGAGKGNRGSRGPGCHAQPVNPAVDRREFYAGCGSVCARLFFAYAGMKA